MDESFSGVRGRPSDFRGSKYLMIQYSQKYSKFLPAVLTLAFLLLSGSWILLTDGLVRELASRDADILTRYQNYKGIIFIFVTGILLFLILTFYVKSVIASQMKLRSSLEETVKTLVHIVEQRDSYTAGHSNRVSLYARKIGEALQMDETTLEFLEKAGTLHDIGKVETPDSILLKPGPLSIKEKRLIQNHSVAGQKILSHISIYPSLQRVIRHHHEWYNGNGYPDGLSGIQIPLESRIITIADAFDAMTSRRVYKRSMDLDHALLELSRGSGTQFDPEIVSASIGTLRSVYRGEESANRSLHLEAERMAYFFRDRESGYYTLDFLQYVKNNMDLVSEGEVWVLDVDFADSENDITEKIMDALNRVSPDTMPIRLSSERYALLFLSQIEDSFQEFLNMDDDRIRIQRIVLDTEENLEALLNRYTENP